MNENEQLAHLNNQPLNRHAKALLVKAKQQPDPSRLHLFQLAEWGVDQPALVENPERLRSLLGNLQARPPEQQQEFLLAVDAGLPSESDRLVEDLPKLKSPTEAATLLLQVLNLHASTRIPHWDKT